VKFKATLASTLLLLTVSAWGQMQAPKPGPEVQKLAYFAGTWTVEGTIGEGPWGAGGKFSTSSTADWMPGGFFLEGHTDSKMPAEIGGDGKTTSYMGYDQDESTYTSDQFNSQGRHESSKGTLTGDTWTWTGSQVYGGQNVQRKVTMKVLSPTSYTMKLEVSLDGTNWMTFMDGKATKK
jgi:hypothetical protein